MKWFSSYSILLLFITVVVGCKDVNQPQDDNSRVSTPQKECIKEAISLDSSLGARRDKASRHVALGQSIRDYIKGMEAISFTGCPQAFTTAFKNHIAAWQDLLPLADKHPELRGELHELFTQLEKGPDGEEFKRRLKAVWDTWAEVEAAMKSR